MPKIPVMRSQRQVLFLVALLFGASLVFLLRTTNYGKDVIAKVSNINGNAPPVNQSPGTAAPGAPPPPPKVPTPKYKPTPTYTPPPVKDPFPLLATSTPPPIPKWNVPKKNLHGDYGLKKPPPLIIGFTRTWPLLLQAVVSYITAGWPADQIYVVENTGVQQSNTLGKLTLQNPFYLNHTTLKKLGVNIVQTPVLLTFAQLQNFYIHMAHQNDWPHYFWSHMDVLALSYEEGVPDLTPPYNQPGYKSVYELCLTALNDTLHADDKWALRFFAYDHLALVNRAAYDDVGGWDTLIPYYIGDCDMHSRLGMAGWSQSDKRAGIITDVAAAVDDLSILYRDPGITPSFTDPNPPPPPPPPAKGSRFRFMQRSEAAPPGEPNRGPIRREEPPSNKDDPLEYYLSLKRLADGMFHHKHSDRGRNTWQTGQRGGFGEPYYYPAEGIAKGFDIITEAGREVYRNKWGHRDCDLASGAGLSLWDQWKVEKDWN